MTHFHVIDGGRPSDETSDAAAPAELEHRRARAALDRGRARAHGGRRRRAARYRDSAERPWTDFDAR